MGFHFLGGSSTSCLLESYPSSLQGLICSNVDCRFLYPSSDINTNNTPLKRALRFALHQYCRTVFLQPHQFSRYSGECVRVPCAGHFQRGAASICAGVVCLFLNKQPSTVLLSKMNSPFCPVTSSRHLLAATSSKSLFLTVHECCALGSCARCFCWRRSRTPG